MRLIFWFQSNKCFYKKIFSNKIANSEATIQNRDQKQCFLLLREITLCQKVNRRSKTWLLMILSILDADIVIDEASYVVGVDVDPDYLDIDVGVSLNYS